MINIDKITDINLKSNTRLLIDYLEAVITDEMALNSFIRDIEIVQESQTEVFIATKNTQSLEFIKTHYWQYLVDAIKNVYQKDLQPHLVVDQSHIDLIAQINTKNESKFISPKFTFDTYVECEFNGEAIKMAKKSIETPGKYSPIFFTSKSGLGKTHLLHALGNEFMKRGLSVRYIEPNRITKNVTEFSKQGGEVLTNYIEELMNHDVLIFDDIQNLGDRAVTLKVLFQILNRYIESGKQIYIASDKLPHELSGFEARFITRFASGLTTTFKEPSLDDLVKVLEFKLAQENLSPESWEREALKFIARNNSSSIRSIEGAVKRVSFYIEDESNVKYTYTVISNIFKELSIDPNELTPSRIISTVASYYKITKADIVGKSRKADIAIARHMAIWLTRKILDLPLIEIGNIFGGRDHSTVMSSIKAIDQKMAMNNMVKVALEKIESKIRSVN